jgi:CopG family nickel-responsive transcriptional regulator
MERITMSLDESLISEFDTLIADRGYENRSEAMRDVLREFIEGNRLRESKATHCVANVSYVYNHHERELATRLTDLQHSHHDLTISSMHTHIDHHNGMETLFLRGLTKAVQQCADRLLAERGVRHGLVNLIPVAPERTRHLHGIGNASAHTHYRPIS